MIRFLSRIFLIALFFIGIGGISKNISNSIFNTDNEIINNSQTIESKRIILFNSSPQTMKKISILRIGKTNDEISKEVRFQIYSHPSVVQNVD